MAEINDNTTITIPLRNLVAIVIAVAMGVSAYLDLIAKHQEQEMKIVFMEASMNRFYEKEWSDLYARMAEVEDKLAEHGHGQ